MTLRNIQYKLTMRIQPTNVILYKYKYVRINLCKLSNCFEETIHVLRMSNNAKSIAKSEHILANKIISIVYNIKKYIMFRISLNRPVFMQVQLFNKYDKIFSFHNESKKITFKLSTLFKIPETP